MADVARGSVLLTPRFDGLKANVTSALGSAFGGASGLSGKAGRGAAKGFGGGFSIGAASIMGAVSSITSRALGMISDSMGAAISRVDTMANFPKVMKNLGYTADDAKASINRMSKAIDGMPTSMDSITGMVQQLAPLTGGLSQATDLGIAFNNALLAAGASSADVSRAMQQYSQALAKGKPDMQDWRTLQEVMPGQLNQLAKALIGPTAKSQDLYKALKSGNITMDDFNAAMVRLSSEGANGFSSFEEQARSATAGIGTAMENVGNRVAKAVAKVLDYIGQENISAAINGVSAQFGPMADALIAGIDAIRREVELLAPAFGDMSGAAQAAMRSVADNAGLALAAVTALGIATAAVKFEGLTKVGPAVDALSARMFKMQVVATMFGNALKGSTGAARGLNKMVEGLGSAGIRIGRGFAAFRTGLSQLAAAASSSAGAVVSAVRGAAGRVAVMFESFTGLVTRPFRALGGIVSRALSGIGARVVAPLAAVAAKVAGSVGGALSAVGGRVASALAPVASAVGSVLGRVGALISPVTSALSTMFGGIGQMAGGILSLVNPFVVVVAAIASVAAGFAYMMSTSEEFRSSVSSALAAIQKGLAPAAEAVSKAFGQAFESAGPVIERVSGLLTGTVLPALGNVGLALLDLAATLAPVIGQLVAAVVPILGQVLGYIGQIASALGSVLMPVFSAIASVIQAVWPVVQTALVSGMQVLLDTVNAVWPLIQTVITVAMQVISGVVQTVMALIRGDWSGAWEGIKATVSAVWNGIKSIVIGAINAVQAVINSVLNAVKAVWGAAWNSVGSLVSGAWNSVTSTVSGGARSVLDTIGRIPSQITGFFANAGNLLVNAGQAIVNGLLDGIKGTIGGVFDFVGGIAGQIAALKGPIPYDLKLLVPNGRAIMQGLGEGIAGGLVGVLSTVSGIAGQISREMDAVPTSYSARVEMTARAARGSVSVPDGGGSGAVLMDALAEIARKLDDINETIPPGLSRRDLIREVNRAVMARA
ncbi:MAG: tape measure protein [Collinsella sp.]|nr:tape measure protein [Collinsella sp.]